MSKLPIKLKPGDLAKVKLSGDVYEVEIVKVNPKTFLAKMFQTKTRYRKVRKDTTGQMTLFDTIANVRTFVKVPYTVRTERLVKLPKGKLVSVREATARDSGENANIPKTENLVNQSETKDFFATKEPLENSPEEPETPTPVGSSIDDLLASLK